MRRFNVTDCSMIEFLKLRIKLSSHLTQLSVDLTGHCVFTNEQIYSSSDESSHLLIVPLSMCSKLGHLSRIKYGNIYGGISISMRDELSDSMANLSIGAETEKIVHCYRSHD